MLQEVFKYMQDFVFQSDHESKASLRLEMLSPKSVPLSMGLRARMEQNSPSSFGNTMVGESLFASHNVSVDKT